MKSKFKSEICEANKSLKDYGLVMFTWGNLSAFRDNTVGIKPSGVPYEILTPEDIVLLNIHGERIDGKLNPSTDTPTHLEIYKNFDAVKSVVHVHSTYATMFAQSKRSIDCLGTTHADHFFGSIPLIDDLCEEEIKEDYEKNMGLKIVQYYKREKIDPLQIPGCIIPSHGVFAWGKDIKSAVYNSVVLEEIAKINYGTVLLNSSVNLLDKSLLNKHYLRKHGEGRYYGQGHTKKKI